MYINIYLFFYICIYKHFLYIDIFLYVYVYLMFHLCTRTITHIINCTRDVCKSTSISSDSSMSCLTHLRVAGSTYVGLFAKSLTRGTTAIAS